MANLFRYTMSVSTDGDGRYQWKILNLTPLVDVGKYAIFVYGGGYSDNVATYPNTITTVDLFFNNNSANPASNIAVVSYKYKNAWYSVSIMKSDHPSNNDYTGDITYWGYDENGTWKQMILSNGKTGTYTAYLPDISVGSGLSQLVTSGNIKSAVYNGITYTPGMTIPLDPNVENITLVNQNYTLTMDNTQNMKNVQIDNTVYSDFPVTVNVEKNTVLQMSGKDDPVITVEYTNTGNPTVINTKV